jgi:hypothetical protein
LFPAAERAFGGLLGSGRAGRAGRVFGRLPRENRGVPESAATSAERKRRAREAARRREAANVLRIGEATCRYGASQIGDGASPAEAREIALFVAGELVAVADALRRLTRLGPAERKVLAKQLAALGVRPRRIAQQLGTCDRTVRYYLAGRQG